LYYFALLSQSVFPVPAAPTPRNKDEPPATLINQQYEAELECEKEIAKEGRKELVEKGLEPPDFGPMYQVPDGGGLPS
jgi:hypothetical protein